MLILSVSELGLTGNWCGDLFWEQCRCHPVNVTHCDVLNDSRDYLGFRQGWDLGLFALFPDLLLLLWFLFALTFFGLYKLHD